MKIKKVSLFVKYTILFLICPVCISAGAAIAESPEYLFDEFKPAYLISNNKKQYQAEVNYSFIYNEFVFKDTNDDNLIKVIDPGMEIRTIKVEDRIFLIDEKKVTREVLQQSPLFMVQYKGRMKPAGKNIGYGGESETAAIDSYSHLYTKSGSPAIELKTSGYKRIGIHKIYEIDRTGKLKTFISQAGFTKLYPKDVRKELEAYSNKQKTDFGDPTQVVELYNYAEELIK